MLYEAFICKYADIVTWLNTYQHDSFGRLSDVGINKKNTEEVLDVRQVKISQS